MFARIPFHPPIESKFNKPPPPPPATNAFLKFSLNEGYYTQSFLASFLSQAHMHQLSCSH